VQDRNSKLSTLRSIGARLHLVTVTAIVAIAILLSSIYMMESVRIEEARIAVLHSAIDTATAVAASFQADEQNGRMTREDAQHAAIRAIGAMRYLGSEYIWINDLHPTMIMHPVKPELNGRDLSDFKDLNGKRLFVAFADTVRARGAGVVDYLWPRPGSSMPVPKLSYVRGFTPWEWVIGTGVYVDDLATMRWNMALNLLALGTGASLLLGSLIWLLGRSVAQPTRNLIGVTELLSKGDLDVDVSGTDRRDELGALARALQVLKANSVERKRLEQAAAADRVVKDQRQAAMDGLTRDFGEVISGVLRRLMEAAQRMSETARALTEGTERTRSSATRTAEGSTLSSRDLSDVANATGELSSSVHEIARQVTNATEATRDAVGLASETDATFVKLVQMAERIGNVGSSISAIAAQTNLLALNATIEAARAGEAGKGFAVVASEVKALATQTARATVEIIDNVAAIRDATHHTAASIREVSSAIGRVDAVAAAIAAAIEEQGATTSTIAGSVRAVAATSEQTASAMAEVASIADGTGDMSQTVLVSADDIGKVADTLRAEVDQFLRMMVQNKSDQRRYERIAAGDAPATLFIDKGREVSLTIDNISRGGAALKTAFQAETGLQVKLLLNGLSTPVNGRIVRYTRGVLAIAFGQDGENLANIDAVMDRICNGQSRGAQAA
jgi:methyl-accepting chemotaxis protein